MSLSLPYIAPIESADNPRLRHVASLLDDTKARRKHGETVLEGLHLIEACLAAGQSPRAIWLSESAQEQADVQRLLAALSPATSAYSLPDALYAKLRSLGPGVDVLAQIATPSAELPASIAQDTLLLDQVQDAGNVGTLLRSARAAGIGQVIATQGTASLWSPRVLRAGMGAHFGLTLIEGVGLDDALPRIQVPIYTTSSHAERSIYDLDLNQPAVWMMGNEGQGIQPAVIARTIGVTIPMHTGTESLNVGVAGSICLFEQHRQRLPTKGANANR